MQSDSFPGKPVWLTAATCVPSNQSSLDLVPKDWLDSSPTHAGNAMWRRSLVGLEGRHQVLYLDEFGNVTVGVGHLVKDREIESFVSANCRVVDRKGGPDRAPTPAEVAAERARLNAIKNAGKDRWNSRSYQTEIGNDTNAAFDKALLGRVYVPVDKVDGLLDSDSRAAGDRTERWRLRLSRGGRQSASLVPVPPGVWAVVKDINFSQSNGIDGHPLFTSLAKELVAASVNRERVNVLVKMAKEGMASSMTSAGWIKRNQARYNLIIRDAEALAADSSDGSTPSF